MRRIGLVADIHCDNFPNLSPREIAPLTTRAIEVAKTISWVIDTCINESVEELWILGDVFHKRDLISVPIFNLVDSVLRQASGHMSLSIVAGNHDQTTKGGQEVSIETFSKIASIYKYITSYQLRAPAENILALPYRESYSSLWDKLDPSKTVIMGHCGIEGSRLTGFEIKGKGEVTREELQLDKLVAGFFGHYHVHQQVAERAWYIGSPLQHSFRDVNNKCGFMLADFANGKLVETQFIENTFSPKFHIVNLEKDHPSNYPITDFLKLINASYDNMKNIEIANNIMAIERPDEIPDIRVAMSLSESVESLINKWVALTIDNPRRAKQLKNLGIELIGEVK
jgi:DNA repair exonuclease SbcCD nuclease subunit